MGSRENSFYKAGIACSQAETASTELQEAARNVQLAADRIASSWRGASGAAMCDGLNAWASAAFALSNRIQSVAAQMRASRQYDYSLWPEEEDT